MRAYDQKLWTRLRGHVYDNVFCSVYKAENLQVLQSIRANGYTYYPHRFFLFHVVPRFYIPLALLYIFFLFSSSTNLEANFARTCFLQVW